MKKQLLIPVFLLMASFVLLSMGVSNLQDPWEVPAKYEKLENPYADTADSEKIGRMLYSKHCKSCHGTKGEGDGAKADSDAEIIAGGGYDKSKGYFIEPTVIVTSNPNYTTMCNELFGPVMTIHVYEDDAYSETLKIVDQTSEYALTGAIISKDRYAVEEATKALQNSAGNFYINDKPTGAVVGQQPFGGARASGTNDKAGSAQNLLRWTSVRLIKETFVTPQNYKYPFLG